MLNKSLFSSKKSDWATPQKFFDEMNAKYGPFETDVCADASNAKCVSFYDQYIDGLSIPWSGKNWMNPPYGREIGKWIKKAYEESLRGCDVVALLPARTDTKWFHNYIYNKPTVDCTFIRGRLKFGGAKHAAPFPSMIVVFKGVK